MANNLGICLATSFLWKSWTSHLLLTRQWSSVWLIFIEEAGVHIRHSMMGQKWHSSVVVTHQQRMSFCQVACCSSKMLKDNIYICERTIKFVQRILWQDCVSTPRAVPAPLTGCDHNCRLRKERSLTRVSSCTILKLFRLFNKFWSQRFFQLSDTACQIRNSPQKIWNDISHTINCHSDKLHN